MKRTISTLLYLHHTRAFPALSSWHHATTIRHGTIAHPSHSTTRHTNRLYGFIESDSETDVYSQEIQLELDNELFDVDGEDINGAVADSENAKKLIECNASIVLPFGADVAFDAFSDLTRQPTWCKYLKSVEYIGFVEDQALSPDSVDIPLRESRWTVSVKGLRFSWTARDTSIQRPNKITWESTSGMKNRGCVEFTTQETNNNTHMKLSFTFVAPRVVSSLFRRSNLLRSYTEDVLLMGMLTDFRDVVLLKEEGNGVAGG